MEDRHGTYDWKKTPVVFPVLKVMPQKLGVVGTSKLILFCMSVLWNPSSVHNSFLTFPDFPDILLCNIIYQATSINFQLWQEEEMQMIDFVFDFFPASRTTDIVPIVFVHFQFLIDHRFNKRIGSDALPVSCSTTTTTSVVYIFLVVFISNCVM